jgi:hypothetical protein
MDSLQQSAIDFLDPDEQGNASEAILFFLVDPDPLSKLNIKNKLILLKAIYELLAVDDQLNIGSREFSIYRTLDSGDYGIDIDDLVPMDGGWNLRVQADGGSGSICPGEDEQSLAFSLDSFLQSLDVDYLCLEDIDWQDLVGSTGADDVVYVTPGEGIEGSGKPSLQLISPTGESIDVPEASCEVVQDGGTNSYSVKIRLEYQCEPLSLSATFNLSELESACLGYNLEWNIKDPLAGMDFIEWVDSLLGDGLVLLRRQYSRSMGRVEA